MTVDIWILKESICNKMHLATTEEQVKKVDCKRQRTRFTCKKCKRISNKAKTISTRSAIA